MTSAIAASTLDRFSTFGDLLRFLRRRTGLTQLELAGQVGYSDGQISRLEQNLRLPDIPTIEARFVPALDLTDEPAAVERLVQLAGSVRREDAPALGLPPYKGLVNFDENDADLFVGREQLTAHLTGRVLGMSSQLRHASRRFLAIVGASGSGKSSLVRAGLIPALRWNQATADWQIQALTPAARPLHSLALALLPAQASLSETGALIDDLAREPRSLHLFLARQAAIGGASRFLLVIDQFEELFSLCRLESERHAFVENLCLAASEPDGPGLVVITMRADFYAHCAAYPMLREALAGNQEFIGAMSSTDLRRVIEEPARRGRWELEPGLVDLLLHEVGNEPGALPLLSHALLETWQRRRSHTLTLSGYTSAGGVRGAIAETAQAVFVDQFSDKQQAIARQIFLRLTELGDETATGDTRRRATIAELILSPDEAEATHAVLKALADARLITLGQDTAEVAHEALIREWPTLRGWLEENREGLRLHRQLTEAAADWSTSNADPDLLFRGARLLQARDWAALHAADLNPSERDFLQASIDLSEHEAAQRQARQRQELEAAQRLAATEHRANAELRRRGLYLVGALLVALGLAVTALYFADRARVSALESQRSAAAAQSSAQHAQQQSRIATARELAAASLSNLNVDPERSILLALQAVATTRQVDGSVQPQAADALHRAVMSSRVLMTLNGHSLSLSGAKYSPDGSRIATVGQDGRAIIWDPASGRLLLTLQNAGPADAVNDAAYSPDGRLLATANDDGSVKLWDAATGRELELLIGHTDFTYQVGFSPDGSRVAAASGDGSVILWDAASAKMLLQVPGASSGGVVLSPDGQSMATANADNSISIRDAASGAELRRLVGHADAVEQISFNSDGSLLASVSDDDTARIWEVATGAQRLRLNLSGAGLGVSFSPDGGRIATSGLDGTAALWQVDSGRLLMTLSGHTGAVYSVSFSPDGQRLLTAGRDGTARVWDLAPSHELLTLQAASPGQGLSSISYSPDGRQLATAAEDAARTWDAATGRLILTLSGHAGAVNSVAFSPTGDRLVTASDDATARIWDASTGRLLVTLRGHAGPVAAAVFSPDGKRIVTASADKTARIWDAATGQALITLAAHTRRVLAVAFSPDGKFVATGSVDHSVILWDALGGRQLASVSTPQRAVTAVTFSPDGRRLIAAFVDGSMRVLDISADGLHMTDALAPGGHAGTITALTYAPDGSTFASASDDNSLKLWDAATGQELLTLFGDTGGMQAVAFSPDGTRLAGAGGDGLVRIYLLRIDDLAALARSRLTRTWTSSECLQFLHTAQCPAGP